MVSPRQYERGIESLLGSADRAFKKAVKDSKPKSRGLINSMRMGVLDDYSLYGRPSMVVPAAPAQTGPVVVRPDASQVLPPQYPSQTVPAAVVAPVAAGPVDPNAPKPIGDIFGDLFGWKGVPYPEGHELEGQPQSPAVYRQTHPSPLGNPGNIILGAPQDLHTVPYELTLEGRPYDANAVQKVVDAAGGGSAPEIPAGPGYLGATGVPASAEVATPTYTPIPGETPTPAQPKPGRLSDEYVDPTTVLPPDNEDVPAVVPVTTVEAPAISAEGLPGTSTETATGALSLDDYIAKMKSLYPDLDFTNPKQAEADANARRDLDRTAMLAQLQMAAGMVSGAGPGWEGIGTGFGNAAGAYDKGFTKYQQALQDSADRYGKQMESQMAYDTARRQAALGLYTAAEERSAASQTELWKAQHAREWDAYKLAVETGTGQQKLAHEDINKYFDKELEGVKPASDPSVADPIEEKRKEEIRRDIMERREASLRSGRIFKAQYNVASE